MGIYVHIPFCRNRCFYCGFYSSASLRGKDAYLKALSKEMVMRTDYLANNLHDTLYFGGGTPSCLDVNDLEFLLQNIHSAYNISEKAEITIEANPEDQSKFADFKKLGFNRLSIGIQSFDDAVLRQINRRHDSRQAMEAIKMAFAAGFENVSIDFIVGLPGQTINDVQSTMAKVQNLPVSHVSIYMLSMDSNSVMTKMCQKGKFVPPDDDLLADFYDEACEDLEKLGFEHYEISNFARNGMYSRHNTSYWQQKPYLGVGAAAHSYDGNSRQWNIDSIHEYTEAVMQNEIPAEKEALSENDKYNELIMTRLRTMWGLDLGDVVDMYPQQWQQAQNELNRYILQNYAYIRNNRLFLTRRGWLASDAVFSDLFA